MGPQDRVVRSAATVAEASTRVTGTVLVLFAYDVGFHVDLAAAGEGLRDGTRYRVVRGRRPSPAWFDYEPPPLRFVVDGEPIAVAGLTTGASIEGVIYDFGAVLLTYRIPVEGPLDGLAPLTQALYDNEDLLADSRGRVETLIGLVREAVTKPAPSDLVEDYFILAIDGWEGEPSRFVESNAPLLARLLQSVATSLSAAEVVHCLSGRMAYADDDMAVIDWNAALLLDREPDDVVALLQHANVELLELRLLDRQLDELLDRSQALLARQSRPIPRLLDRGARGLREFAELQTDSALLFEGVNNAIKLLGDQYLARLYRLAAAKLHLPEWDASVLRKLATAESVYQKISDGNANSRLELLEIVIIVLIAVSIVLPFVVGGGY
jgi:hypothetical protein